MEQTPKEIQETANLMHSFRQVIERLEKCKRWADFTERNYIQNSLHHSFSIAVLTSYLINREEKLGDIECDKALLITHALVHDFSEGVTGDVTFHFKNDPRLKMLHDIIEHEQTLNQIDELPFLSASLKSAYELPSGSFEARFFAAVEFLDYFLYALSEYQIHKTQRFASVLRDHHQHLIEYSNLYPSFAEIYTPEVQKGIAQIFKKEKDLMHHRQMKLPDDSHLDQMADATIDLLEKLSDGDPEKKATLSKKIIGKLS